MAVVGRAEEQFRVVNEAFDGAQFFAHDGLDELIGELCLFDDTDELAVIDDRSDVAFMDGKPFGCVFQAGVDGKAFDVRVDGFADFDVEILYQGLGRYVEIVERESRFFIRFAGANGRSVNPL